MNFSPKKYSQLKSRLKRRYSLYLAKTLIDLKKLPKKNISHWIQENHSELNEYSELNWHFLSQLQLFNFFNRQPSDLGKTEFGDIEEEVFEKWNASEFAASFLKSLNQGIPLGKANDKTIKELDKHLVEFGERHILKNESSSSFYRVQSSLGEYLKGKKLLKLLETTLHLDGKDLRLMTLTMKEMKSFSQRIEIALKIIKKHSPSSWERFIAFTEVIVPISQEELVSYSHQDLPGYSMINLYHRDFVDLMDDLLHENGHHHMNHYLNLGNLIEEPIDNIYYSPWRRTLRPLRGIFHAYFTFFWAFKLFIDLSKAKEIDSIYYLFSEEEKEKILWRAIEEFHMLNFTFQDLKWARKNGLIHDAGWELILEQQKEVRRYQKFIPVIEKKLRHHKKELIDLKKTLKTSKEKFTKK
jgi:hypothetical protein